MKKYLIPLIYLIAIILLLLFNRFRWDIVVRTNYMVGTISTAILICFFCCITIVALIYAIVGIKNKSWQSCLPLILLLLTVVYVLYFAFTPVFARLDYQINQNSRNKVVSMVDNGEIAEYQVNNEQYMPPQRMASYDGIITVKSQGTDRFILFNSFIGFGKTVITVYSFNPKDEFDESIYNNEIHSIVKLNSHWFSLVIG